MRSKIIIGLTLLLALAAASPSLAANARQGQQLAKLYCMKCHAIDKVSPSPFSLAPPFRDLHLRYPVEDLEEALGEGITTGHPSMPQFQFEPDQVADFIQFLKSLEPSK